MKHLQVQGTKANHNANDGSGPCYFREGAKDLGWMGGCLRVPSGTFSSSCELLGGAHKVCREEGQLPFLSLAGSSTPCV